MPLKTVTKRLRRTYPIAALLYRTPLQVNEVLLFASGDSYPICPRCDSTIDREYMRFCDCCGQRLGWEFIDVARIVNAPRCRQSFWDPDRRVYVGQQR